MHLPRLQRGSENEWLDDLADSEISATDLSTSLHEVRRLNALVGATREVVRDVFRLLPRGGSVLDVGTGAADTPVALLRESRRRHVPVDVTGLDISREILDVARNFVGGEPVNLITGDARDLSLSAGSVDVVISLGVMHHFSEDDAVQALREMWRVARTGIAVFDLERTYPTYIVGRAALRTLTRNPLTNHDGNISIRRSFTRMEVLGLAQRADLAGIEIRRRRLILYSLTCRKS